ncbi:MAG TPA: pantoate--beta-alanine ligase [Spirochaetes bacterium]|nr:pantoate--beta-alanine ligase [Spirochaetota bacterium]
MEITHTIEDTREKIKQARTAGRKIGFVPTMGYLHRGHLSLVEEARKLADYQVMSIFVNRIQFNDPRDFDTYPRDLERDFAMARDAGVDLMFVPDDREMYRNPLTCVDMETLPEHLCGAARPGHFRGVFTVVSKLFNIVQPDCAVFGQKDIQQAVSIEKMTVDLNFPVRVVIAPTVREEDGLAMSSRNKRLSPEERSRATVIFRGLEAARGLISGGEKSAAVLLGMLREVIESGRPRAIDYTEMVDYETLQPADALGEKSVIAAAVFFGNTRLIDNMLILREGPGYRCVY